MDFSMNNEFAIDEDNVSSVVSGYETPNAFGDNNSVDDGAYIVKSNKSDRFF